MIIVVLDTDIFFESTASSQEMFPFFSSYVEFEPPIKIKVIW